MDEKRVCAAISEFLEPMPSLEGVSNNATVSPLGFWRSWTDSKYAPWDWYWIPRYDYYHDEAANARLRSAMLTTLSLREWLNMLIEAADAIQVAEKLGPIHLSNPDQWRKAQVLAFLKWAGITLAD